MPLWGRMSGGQWSLAALTCTPQASPCGLSPSDPRHQTGGPCQGLLWQPRTIPGSGPDVERALDWEAKARVWVARSAPRRLQASPPASGLLTRPSPGPQHPALRLRAPKQHSPHPCAALPHPEPSARHSCRSASCRGCRPPSAQSTLRGDPGRCQLLLWAEGHSPQRSRRRP